MRACSRVGIDLSWRCNWNCRTCFYHFDERLHKAVDKPLVQIQQEVDAGVRRGCDHALAIGWGEPAIAPSALDFITYCKTKGITSSMITNGAAPLERYQAFFEAGINHVHVSVHGLGDVLDSIAGVKRAAAGQARLERWLADNGKPWRSNSTLQQENYRQLGEIVADVLEHGARHVVLLGFLPHYHWGDPAKMRTVAVHPAELQPQVERCLDRIAEAGRLATLRYHPMCFLRPEYWKYVVNARYVLFDPWEWDYGHCDADVNRVWPHALGLGAGTEVAGPPCSQCCMQLHCGGWNRFYVQGLNIELRALTEKDVPQEHRRYLTRPGHWHDLNPANHAPGFFTTAPAGTAVDGLTWLTPQAVA